MDVDAAWAEEEFGEAELGDVRRNARLVQLASVLGAQPSCSLPDASDDPATLKAAYRFFDNDHVRAQAMLQSHILSTSRRMHALERVLAVQDTTYLDFTSHPNAPRRICPAPCCWTRTNGTPCTAASNAWPSCQPNHPRCGKQCAGSRNSAAFWPASAMVNRA